MSRVIWKQNAIISVETRRGVFTLAQMAKKPYLIFFDIFQDSQDWEISDLEGVEVLFCKAVTSQFTTNSNIIKCKNIRPNLSYKIPNQWLHSDSRARKIVFWEGTEKEKEAVWLGSRYSLVSMDVVGHTGGPRKHSSGVFDEVLQKDVSKDDHHTIDSFETTGLSVYPETNERLYLCFKFGRNVSPEKDITLGRHLPDEYKTFIKLIGTLSENEKSEIRRIYSA